MHSIRTKLTAVTTGAIVITMIIVTVLGVIAIRDIGQGSSEQTLMLLCEVGQENLNGHLHDVESGLDAVSAYVEADLDGLDDEQLLSHVDRVSDFFKKVIYRTNGIVTYYYRIDPSISQNVKGFWYVNPDGGGFWEHEVTDITQFDTKDTSDLVWFTVPKVTGRPSWLAPYITNNLDVRVISYNVPVYYDGRFVGVIGIELDYEFISDLVKSITLYENGYAFVSDSQGKLVCHPRIDVEGGEDFPDAVEVLKSDGQTIRYTYEGVEKLSVQLPLINGDRINVSVPVEEIDARWKTWVNTIVIAFSVLLAAFIVFFMRYTKRITQPLIDLTEVAEQIDAGNYDFTLDYKGDDEIGILTQTFKRVTSNLKQYITDLNDLAYADALTSLRNKGAFDIHIEQLQTRLDETGVTPAIAVCVFDCNNLKQINDRYGHDKGDIYLKEAAEIICQVFDHSPVFRVGGDEFAALLMDADYGHREELLLEFDRRCAEKRSQETDAWRQVDVARGMAVFDPVEFELVSDVVRRADRLMYQNKWKSKGIP